MPAVCDAAGLERDRELTGPADTAKDAEVPAMLVSLTWRLAVSASFGVIETVATPLTKLALLE
jgi:hypothetical protein